MLHGQRESDGDYWAPTHPTYTNRPKVELQIASAACKLEDQRPRMGTVGDHVPPAVPPTNDTMYDPRNERADWGGMVCKDNLGKKLFTNHASMARGIEQTEHGMVSVAPLSEWGRKRVPTEISKVLKYGNEGIIGGITCENRWETESARFSSGAGTRLDQLSMSKQAAAIKRPMQDPLSLGRSLAAASNNSTPRHRDKDEYYYDGDAMYQLSEGRMGGDGRSLVGYKAPPQTKSLLSNLANSIANSVKDDFKPEKSAAAIAMIGQTQKSTGSSIPGYTGHRRRNF